MGRKSRRKRKRRKNRHDTGHLLHSTNIEVSPSESAILLKKLLKSLSIFNRSCQGPEEIRSANSFCRSKLTLKLLFCDLFMFNDILFVLSISKKMYGFYLISFSLCFKCCSNRKALCYCVCLHCFGLREIFCGSILGFLLCSRPTYYHMLCTLGL